MTIVRLTLFCLSHIVKEQLQDRRRFQFGPLFLSPISTFLGLLVRAPLLSKEVARWASDKRIAMDHIAMDIGTLR